MPAHVSVAVLIPGLDDSDERVKIISSDDSQQGILDSWKTKVSSLNIPFDNCVINHSVFF